MLSKLVFDSQLRRRKRGGPDEGNVTRSLANHQEKREAFMPVRTREPRMFRVWIEA